ncbi:MAG: DUF4870 domain-containing protein [Deltaproteobacteria bacterium]|nr:DUF4870 domain-containing protein [Deltaproteobacteria bacterium]
MTNDTFAYDRTSLTASDADRGVAGLLHLATIALSVFTAGILDIIVPAVAYLMFAHKSAFLRSHIREQLNFQLTLLIAGVVAVVFSVVTLGAGMVVAIPVWIFLCVVDLVCSIIAALKARDGETYEFPFALNIIR